MCSLLWVIFMCYRVYRLNEIKKFIKLTYERDKTGDLLKLINIKEMDIKFWVWPLSKFLKKP